MFECLQTVEMQAVDWKAPAPSLPKQTPPCGHTFAIADPQHTSHLSTLPIAIPWPRTHTIVYSIFYQWLSSDTATREHHQTNMFT